MQAKVKSEYRWKNLVAFSGHEFTKSEFRPVPAGFEEEAKKHPFLELMEDKAPAPANVEPASKQVKVEKPTAEVMLEEMVNLEPVEMLVEAEPEPEPEKKPRTSKKKE